MAKRAVVTNIVGGGFLESPSYKKKDKKPSQRQPPTTKQGNSKAQGLRVVRMISFLSVIFCAFLLAFGVAMFFIGYHAADATRDLGIMAFTLKGDPASWEYCSTGGHCASFDTAYNNGINQEVMGLLLSILGSAALVINLAGMAEVFKIPMPGGER